MKTVKRERERERERERKQNKQANKQTNKQKTVNMYIILLLESEQNGGVTEPGRERKRKGEGSKSEERVNWLILQYFYIKRSFEYIHICKDTH